MGAVNSRAAEILSQGCAVATNTSTGLCLVNKLTKRPRPNMPLFKPQRDNLLYVESKRGSLDTTITELQMGAREA